MTNPNQSSRTAWAAAATAALALLIMAAAAPGAAGASPEPDEEANKRIVRQYVEHCLDTGEPACFERFRPEEEAVGSRKMNALRRSYFPDLDHEITDLLADGDRVVAVLRVRGRHTGEGKPVKEGDVPPPPSGGELDVEEVLIVTVADGQIVEAELHGDLMGVAKAMGYTFRPPEEQ